MLYTSLSIQYHYLWNMLYCCLLNVSSHLKWAEHSSLLLYLCACNVHVCVFLCRCFRFVCNFVHVCDDDGSAALVLPAVYTRQVNQR